MDFKIFNEMNAVVQAEPSSGQNPETLGSLAAIGIKKGQPFNPDDREKEILYEAAEIGAASVRTIISKPREAYFYLYPNSSWMHPLAYRSHLFEYEGARLIDARTAFHFYITGITSVISAKFIGKGS